MPYVKQWIEQHAGNWLPKLVEEFKIDVVRDASEPSLVSLKYNMIESPMAEPIVQECRGMIVLDQGSKSRILCHPYNKFWNIEEGHAASIDWNSARVFDKLDGSLALLYALDGVWNFGSSGSPRGGGRYGSQEGTFGDMFWKVFQESGMTLPPEQTTDVGFFFELVAPDNRIVVQYEKPQLILHGARNRETEREWSFNELKDFAEAMNWPFVASYPLTSAEEVLAAAKALNPTAHEGYIVVDGNFNRVKVKSPRYVALHHLRDKFTTRGVIQLWKNGEISEVLSYFPENTAAVMELVDKLEAACQQAFDAYTTAKALPTRKEFAQAVIGHHWTSICFKLLDTKAETVHAAKEILRNASDSVAEHILEG